MSDVFPPVAATFREQRDGRFPDGLAVRDACARAGTCPVCGATAEADREHPGYLTFRHADECPALVEEATW